MKFEDYLKSNKEELQPKVSKEAIWDQISSQLPPPKSVSNSKYLGFGIIALMAVFILYLYVGKQNNDEQIKISNQELIALKSEINSLIKKENTSSRIRAVNLSHDAKTIDKEILATLIDRMINDSSPNVQLAAVRALEDQIKSESVRIAMIETLSKSQDRYLQIKLINLLSQIHEKRLLPYLDSIIGKDNKQSIVLEQAKKNKKILKEI